MKFFIVVILVFLFTACMSEPDQKNKLETKPQTSTIFDAQLDSLEKAKGVEQSLEDAVKQREEAMRKQGT